MAASLLGGRGRSESAAQANTTRADAAAPPAHQGHNAGLATRRRRAFDAAMARMHDDMGQASANADETIMRMMIPHLKHLDPQVAQAAFP